MVYKQGALRDDVLLSDIDAILREPEAVVWLDVDRPSEADFELLRREFDVHPLAIQDVHTAHQRPKLDQYGDSRLIVLFDVDLDPNQGLVMHEVDLFIGSNYLITVHRSPIPTIDELRQRWLKNPNMMDPSPLGFLLYHLADGLVDEYFPVTDALEEKIDEIEEGLFSGGFNRSTLREIFALRRSLIEFRKILGPERDVFNILARRDDPVFDQSTVAYFTDVIDLLLRVTETVDTMRDLLGAALDSYLSVQSNALGDIVKRMTALTITLMVPTLIAGIYGMNFHVMPELGWHYGYAWALGLMVFAVLTTLVIFRRKDWL